MKINTKSFIIDTTIALIQESDKNPEDITIRDISKAAGIAVSQINYHFQTKENLLAQCVQKMMEGIIQKFDDNVLNTPSVSALQRLEYMINLTYEYLYQNENLARISILTEHKSPSLDDNTSQTMRAYRPLIKEACAECNISEPELLICILIQALQGVFLRTDITKQELGIDLRNNADREEFIHDILEKIFG